MCASIAHFSQSLHSTQIIVFIPCNSVCSARSWRLHPQFSFKTTSSQFDDYPLQNDVSLFENIFFYSLFFMPKDDNSRIRLIFQTPVQFSGLFGTMFSTATAKSIKISNRGKHVNFCILRYIYFDWLVAPRDSFVQAVLQFIGIARYWLLINWQHHYNIEGTVVIIKFETQSNRENRLLLKLQWGINFSRCRPEHSDGL